MYRRLYLLMAVAAWAAGCSSETPSVVRSAAPQPAGPAVAANVAKSVPAPSTSGPSTAAPTAEEQKLAEMCKPQFPIRVASTTPAPRCDIDCTSFVDVEKTGLSSCTASWKYSEYEVGKGKRVFLRWTLRNKTAGDGVFKFDRSLGIGLCPGSQNDDEFDLGLGRCQKGTQCQTYQWFSLNARPRDNRKVSDPSVDPKAAIHFGIIVKDDRGVICDAVDPMIVNLGN
jgi:hypothetical protein